MIRLSTLVWAVIAGLTGFAVYQLKFEVQSLEEELARANRAILDQQVAIHVLRAEWSYLNQPDRLRELAGRHLELQPTHPTQIGQVIELPKRGQPEAPVASVAGKSTAPSAARKAEAVRTATKPATVTPAAATERKPAPQRAPSGNAVPVGHAQPGTR